MAMHAQPPTQQTYQETQPSPEQQPQPQPQPSNGDASTTHSQEDASGCSSTSQFQQDSLFDDFDLKPGASTTKDDAETQSVDPMEHSQDLLMMSPAPLPQAKRHSNPPNASAVPAR
jgi:hypothetical protein